MKKLLIAAIILIYIPFLLTAQEDTLQKLKIYHTWIRLYNGSEIEGILYQVKDSSVLLANTVFKMDLLSGKYQAIEHNYNSLLNIKVRPLNKGIKGAIYGLIGGLVTGVFLGIASGDDPPNQLFRMTAGQKATIGGIGLGLIGTGIGGMIGAMRIIIPINGNLVKFKENKEMLKQYSYTH
jgi:hypothetical protein